MTDSPYALSVAEAIKLSGLGRSYIYLAIQRGELPVRKAGRRTLILRTNLEDWIDSLPMGGPATNKHHNGSPIAGDGE